MTLPAGAALGASTDPKQLIHGDPGVVRSVASFLKGEARKAQGWLGDIDSLDVAPWTGFAALAHESARDEQTSKLTAYADRFQRAAGVLEGFHGALTEAQASAAQAIEKWQEGERASKAALHAYNASVDKYNAQVKQYNQSPITRAIQLVPPGPFEDPGQALRDEAEKILEDARTKLDEAGSSAVAAFTDPLGLGVGLGGLLGGGAVGSALGLGGSASGSVETGWVEKKGLHWDGEGSGSFPDGEKKWGTDPSELPDEEGKKKPAISGDVTVAGASIDASVLHAEGKTEGHIGDLSGKAEGSVDVLNAGAGADLKVGTDGVEVGADGHAYLVHAKGEASADYGPLGADAKGEAYVGADANASVGIGKDGVHAGGEAFAGAKATADLDGDVGGVGGGVHAEAWAGAGAAADLDVGMHDGKLKIGGEFGLGLGVGAKIGPNVTLDFPKMYDTGKDLAHDAGNVADSVVDHTTVAVDDAVDTGKKVVSGLTGGFLP